MFAKSLIAVLLTVSCLWLVGCGEEEKKPVAPKTAPAATAPAK